MVDLKALRALAEFAAPARSRCFGSFRLALAMTGRWSVRAAVRTRRRGIPPKRATSRFLPLSRSMTGCRRLRGPAGVSMTVLYFPAIFRP